ncbi:hypothetical protein BG011_000402 [Mortierella polycephala]|uniref:Uncharacterized protein n=1 Tax=Mortierella polycephala TaxID=41804 RepID=A0A9P6U6U5_9FUNG|nr:hypothetical protein BG011_000402 [Mortierella polycephala]
MCNHHFDAMLGEDGTDLHDLQTEHQHDPGHSEQVLSREDSFEIPDTRADLDESKATDHGALEHENTPFYSYHAEKALKLEDNKYLAHETHTPSKPVIGLSTLPRNGKAAMLFDTTPENLRKLCAQ